MRILQTLAAAAMLAAVASPVAAQSDITGTWTASFVTADRTYPARIELKQDSDKLTGIVGGANGTEGNKLTGTVKENDVTFAFMTPDPNGGGRTLAIAVKASITAGGLDGSFDVDDAPSGTFTAKREAKDSKDPKPPAAGASSKAPAADVAGTWALTVDLGSLTASPTVVLKQDGTALTGTYTSPQYGQFPLQGTVKGNDVQFNFTMTIEGNSLDVHFQGTADKDGLKGSVNYSGLGEGTFVGKKK